MQATRIIAIRHGETAWNVDTRIQGHLDIPLNDIGRWQARRVAEVLADEGIDFIYASDLGRAFETAQALGKSPVVTDGDATLAESGAIIDYLAHTYGREALLPHDPAGLLRYSYWLHFAEGSAMSPLLLKLIFDRVR